MEPTNQVKIRRKTKKNKKLENEQMKNIKKNGEEKTKNRKKTKNKFSTL